jgi:hypothetical protein
MGLKIEWVTVLGKKRLQIYFVPILVSIFPKTNFLGAVDEIQMI